MNLRQQLQVDVALQFGRYCKSELDDAAREKLGKAIDEAVFNQLKKSAFSWDEATRRFILGRVAQAARDCDKRAKAGGGVVTSAMMRDMGEALVPKWKKTCKIPDEPDEQRMGPLCPVAAAVLLAM